MTTRFEDFTRQQAVAEENVLLRQRLAQLGTTAPPLPENISPDEENFFLRRFAGEADPAIRAESQRRFLSILIEPFAAPAAAGFAKFLAATGLGPQTFQQAVAEERAAPPPAIQPIGRAERRALERTRRDFPQIPLELTLRGERGEEPSFGPLPRQVGLAEVGETFFDPFIVAPAARPVARGAAALGRAGVRGAERAAIGVAERALGPRGAVGAAPAPRIRQVITPVGRQTVGGGTFQQPKVSASLIDDAARIPEARVANESFAKPPPPKKPVGKPAGGDMGTPPPRRPDVGLSDDLELPTFEKPTQGVMRKWDGARSVEGLSMQEWFESGNQALRRSGVREFNEETMRPLFEALHGERAADTLSPNLRGIYDDLISLRNMEERDMLEFLGAVKDEGSRTLMAFDAENFTARMMAHPDYFPRGWNIPERVVSRPGVPRGRVGVTPGFARPRVDASFTDLLDWAKTQGGGPASWNPYAMMAQRRMAGVEYRESVKLINRLRTLGKALPVNEAPQNWRVPKVGPVFEGRPVPLADVPGGISHTRPISVPNDVADFLEGALGVPSNITGLDDVLKWSTRLKRLKLSLSLFQHVDFLVRAGGTAFTPTAIRQGAPFRAPSFLWRYLNVSTRAGARRKLRQEILSGRPFRSSKKGVSPRMAVEEGWGVQGDITLIRRAFLDALDDPSITRGLWGKSGAQLRKVREFVEGGLFDGAYRQAQWWAMEEHMVPWVERVRPNATARQVAAEAAENVNIMYSTVADWQTVLKNQDVKKMIQSVIFSTNENEGLLRGAARFASAPGREGAGIFREWYAGLFVFLSVMGNAINFAATGQPLPRASYVPIDFDDPYSPFNWGYNNRFLSPQIPFVRGRNDTPVYADLVGQMDTALRWGLDPIGALAARTNVLPRAIMNQGRGESFFGQKLDSPTRRLGQAIVDLVAPIGPTSLLGAARDSFPALQSLFVEGESRLGAAGQAVQATGINLRGEPTDVFLDRVAQPLGVGIYDNLEPFQKFQLRNSEAVKEELVARSTTAAARGGKNSQYYARLDEIDANRLAAEAEVAAAKDIIATDKRNLYYTIQDRSRILREGAAVDFGMEFEEPRPDELPTNASALDEYYGVYDEDGVKLPDGTVIWDRYERELGKVERKFTPEQREYILRNTNFRVHTPEILPFLADSTKKKIRDSEAARTRFGLRQPEPVLAR